MQLIQFLFFKYQLKMKCKNRLQTQKQKFCILLGDIQYRQTSMQQCTQIINEDANRNLGNRNNLEKSIGKR